MSLADKLRTTTNKIHLKLHEHPALQDLLSKHVTYEYYQNVIGKFYRFHSAYEQALSTSSHQQIYQKYRSDTLPLLKRDHETHPHKGKAERSFKTGYRFNNEESVWAYLYVKEGSLLGGRMIHKQLLRNLPGYSEHNLFFKGLAKDTNTHWQQFKNELDQSSSKLENDLVCLKANEIFNELNTWMGE